MLRQNAGGDFMGDFADGAIKPSIGQDYAPTGFVDTLLGQPIPPSGDPKYAKTSSPSQAKRPQLTWTYFYSPIQEKTATIIRQSLENAGFKSN